MDGHATLVKHEGRDGAWTNEQRGGGSVGFSQGTHICRMGIDVVDTAAEQEDKEKEKGIE